MLSSVHNLNFERGKKSFKLKADSREIFQLISVIKLADATQIPSKAVDSIFKTKHDNQIPIQCPLKIHGTEKNAVLFFINSRDLNNNVAEFMYSCSKLEYFARYD